MGQRAVMGALESSASKLRTPLPAEETQLSRGLRGREGIEEAFPNALTHTEEELWGTDV